MGYEYQLLNLTSVEPLGGALRPTINVLTATPPQTVAIGEQMKLECTVFANGATYIAGQRFWLNLALFNPSQRPDLPPLGAGWRFDVSGTAGSLVVTAAFEVSGGALQILRNFTVQNIVVSGGDTLLSFDVLFYVTNDTLGWIRASLNNNESRFLRSTNAGNLTQNNVLSAYLQTRFFEVCFYETDLLNQPASILFGDPYARDPAAPGFKTISLGVRSKFYDMNVLGAQSWGATILNENALETFAVRVSGQLICDLKRRPRPFLTNTIDLNFDGTQPNALAAGAGLVNEINANITTPAVGVYAKILARLIRVDKSQFQNISDFIAEYEESGAAIPASDATPAPNWIGGSAFGTPTLWSVSGTQLNVQCKLDGGRLVFGARYRVLLLCFAASGFVSTHLTPELVASAVLPVNLTSVVGEIITYNANYTNVNDLLISPYERYKMRLTLAKASYTGADFDAELSRIELVETFQFGGIARTNVYSFAPNASNANSRIVVESNDATNLVVSLSARGYANASVSNQSSLQRWRIVFAQPLPSGATQEVAILFDQFIRIKPENATRIVGLRTLDYTDYLASILTPVETLCAGDQYAVVEVEKSGAPDANLIALFIAANVNAPTEPAVFEEESYLGLLPISTTPILAGVDAAFGDDKAYYLIDLAQLPTQVLTYQFGALIYNI